MVRDRRLRRHGAIAMARAARIGETVRLDGERAEVLGYHGLRRLRVAIGGRLQVVPAARFTRHGGPVGELPRPASTNYTDDERDVARWYGLTPAQVRSAWA